MRYNLKTSLQRIVSLIICFVFIFSFAPDGKKAFAEPVIIDFETTGLEIFTISQNGGVNIKTAGGNSFMNISPNIDGINTFSSYSFVPKDSIPVEISYDFMINDYMYNGTTIASVTTASDQFLELSIEDGALVAKSPMGVKMNVLNEIAANRWYNLKLVMDFTQNRYSVYIDGSIYLVDEAGLASNSFTDKNVKLSFSTKYFPGIAIDNFMSGDFQVANKITITGNMSITLADGEAHTESYTASAFDSEGKEIPDASFSCDLMPADRGVTASSDGKIITLNISSDAPAGDYTVYAICGSKIKSEVINISRYTPEIKSIEITGDGEIAYGFNDNTYAFSVRGVDQTGKRIASINATYSLEGEVPSQLSLDSATGIITVTGELEKDKHITLRAVCNDNPEMTAEKKLTLQDFKTYQTDSQLFTVLKDHINNVWQFAKDPYNDTPLISLAIDRLEMEPALWYLNPEGDYILPCTVAAYSQLFRASDTVYMLTGEDKYRDRVDDMHAHFIDNFEADNGLAPWGNHDNVDLVTHTHYICDTPAQELKGHDPYMESVYRVRPEFGIGNLVSNFSIQIKDWNTMALSRHAYFYDQSNPSLFYEQTKTYTPSNVGYSPAYTRNLGFAATCYGFSRMAIDMYRYCDSVNDDRKINAANAFMRINDAFWKVASPDKDLWLDVAQNTTAGRKGYPDEAVEGLDTLQAGPYNPLTGEYEWWKLDPVPAWVSHADFGDRFWRGRGDDLIDQGYITEDEQWIARECYVIDGLQINPPFLYWDFVDAVKEDMPEYADMVAERAIRNVSNWIRLAYEPSGSTFHSILANGTKLTGFTAKRQAYGVSIGQTYKTYGVSMDTFLSVVFNYLKALDYHEEQDRYEYPEQLDIMENFITTFADNNDFGVLGAENLGDAGTDVNLNTTDNSYAAALAFIYLYEATENVQFLDMARIIAQNYVNDYVRDGFFLNNANDGAILTGGDASNGVFIMALLQAAIRGEFDKCPAYVKFTGYMNLEAFVEHAGEHVIASETAYYGYTLPSVKIKYLNLKDKEIQLKVGESYKVEYTVYPDDSADTGVYIAVADDSVLALDFDNHIIRGVKPGVSKVLVRSTADITKKDILTVTVTE